MLQIATTTARLAAKTNEHAGRQPLDMTEAKKVVNGLRFLSAFLPMYSSTFAQSQPKETFFVCRKLQL